MIRTPTIRRAAASVTGRTRSVHMRHVLGAAVLLACLVLPIAAQQQPDLVRIHADRANVRVAPSLDSAVIRTLPKGTVLTVVGRDSGWVKVELAELQLAGWVAKSLVEPVGSGAASPAVVAAKATAAPAAAGAPPPPSSSASSVTHVASPPSDVVPTNPAPPPPSSSRTSNLPPLAAAPAGAPASDHVRIQLLVGWLRFTETGSAADPGSAHAVQGDIGFVIPVGTNVGLMPEIGMNRASNSVSDDFEDTDVTELRVAYDAVASLLVRPRFGSASHSIFVVVGPTVTYDVHCSGSIQGGGQSESFSCTGTGSQRLDYGLTGGIGATLGPLLLQARLTFGVRNLDSDPGESVKSRTLLLAGGLLF
ncbi:MAG TPA: SH3 domain-containing protein [Gemmatimonadales bacterium]